MKKKKKTNNYFTKETEKYIIEYNNSSDPEYRKEIFTKYLHYPFYKLAENIIHTFKFYYIDVDNLEDLKHIIVSMILEEKIHKFDPTVGSKAYSYFGTIIKRWLINYTDKNYKKKLQESSFEEIKDSYENPSSEENPFSLDLSQFIDMWIEKAYNNLPEIFPKKRERQIADAVLTIFKTRYDLEIFKKKALYIYIREMTDCETSQLTKVVYTLKENFYELYNKYLEKGFLDIKEV